MNIYQLRALVRQALKDSDDPDPNTVTPAVFEQIPKRAYGELLEALLDYVVLDQVRYHRRDVRRQEHRAGQHVSSKVAGARAASDRLRVRVYFNDGTWKFYGDMTAADCFRSADECDERADQLKTVAAERRAVGEAITKAGVKTVAELEKHNSKTTDDDQPLDKAA